MRLGSRDLNTGTPQPGRRTALLHLRAPAGVHSLPTKRTGPGRPRKDDHEAVEAVQSTRFTNSRIGYREAARRYFRENPEKLGGVKLESAARRVADKAMEADGRRPNRSYLEHMESIVFRLNIVAMDLHRLAQRLKGELPADGNSGTRKGMNLLTAIISMEEILEEIRRQKFDDNE